MFELTIENNVYKFNFGMGFMREINKKVNRVVDGLPDVKKNIGLQYYVAGILDGDIEALVEVLGMANKNQDPRVSKDKLDNYIDDESTDIEKLFENVIDFLKKANATKKTTQMMIEAVEEAKTK